MPNLDITIREYEKNTPSEFRQSIALRVQGVRKELADEVKDLIDEAVRIGADVARQMAPRSGIFRNEGHRISDSIVEGPRAQFGSGGSGGGWGVEGRFYATSMIAPHLPYVWEGTADKGAGIIEPAKGNVLALQKEGDTVHFRAWVSGQKPQTEWWELAQKAAEDYLNARIQGLR